MGCDIHFFVEVRDGFGWRSADAWEREDDDEPHLSVPYAKRLYRDRNYDLFAIFADVRNGRGFAGIKTGEGFSVIAPPRGLPDDATDLVRAESDRWNGDGHSHSWLMLAEIFAFDWTQITHKTGVVNAVEFHRWNSWRRGYGEGPYSYSGAVSGTAVEHIGEEEMKRRLAELGDRPSDKQIAEALPGAYCRVEWSEPYYQCCRPFWSDTVPRLLRLGNPEDVRLVFWFDN